MGTLVACENRSGLQGVGDIVQLQTESSRGNRKKCKTRCKQGAALTSESQRNRRAPFLFSAGVPRHLLPRRRTHCADIHLPTFVGAIGRMSARIITGMSVHLILNYFIIVDLYARDRNRGKTSRQVEVCGTRRCCVD